MLGRRLHWRNEAIPTSRDGFHVARVVGIVGERRSDLPNAEVDALIEIDERLGAPENVTDFVPGDQLTGTGNE